MLHLLLENRIHNAIAKVAYRYLHNICLGLLSWHIPTPNLLFSVFLYIKVVKGWACPTFVSNTVREE